MPASPRSPPSDTGKPGVPLARLLAAAETAGYAVELKQAVSAHGGVNPTRVDLRHGPRFVRLLVYSWYITLEGKGRQKDDFRIQTTRVHDGPLMSERGRVSVGVGLRLEDDLFIAFDAWAKRFSGKSTSVHTKRAFIDELRTSGYEVGGMRHDPRCGFDASHVDGFVRWAHEMGATKVAGLVPARWEKVDDDNATVIGSVNARYATGRLRTGDRLIIFAKNKTPADPGLWQIRELHPIEERTANDRPRWLVEFACRRVGKVDDLAAGTIDSLL
jgi:hypothetical protein